MNITVDRLDQLGLLASLASEIPIALDLETEATDPETIALDMIDTRVCGIALAGKNDVYYIDFYELTKNHPTIPYDNIAFQVWMEVYPLLDTTKHMLVAHNAPFDLYHLKKALRETLTIDYPTFKANWWDTQSMAVLYDENMINVSLEINNRNTPALSLKALSRVFLDRKQEYYNDSFAEWTHEERVSYGCDDARNCYDLAVLFSRELDALNLLAYYSEFVAPLVFVLEEMEENGIRVDVPTLYAVQEEVDAKIRDLVARVQQIAGTRKSHKYALKAPWTKKAFIQLAEDKHWVLPTTATGQPSVTAAVLETLACECPKEWDWDQVRETIEEPFNHRSNPALGEYLTSVGCRLPRTPSGQYSVSEETLKEAVKGVDHPIFEVLFKLRNLEKLKGTYIDGVLNIVWDDNTVHPQWHGIGTTSGRFSCTGSSKNKHLKHKRGPALQTIPAPGTLEEQGWPYNPRRWYIPQDGNTLIVADLSQAEVRMLAVMSQDPVLVTAVNSGEDLHTAMARRVFGQTFEEAEAHDQKKMRTFSKMVTFGTMYGLSGSGLAERLKVSLPEAEQIQDQFYGTFEDVARWKAKKEQEVLMYGHATTYYGRKRRPILLQSPPRVEADRRSEPDQWNLESLQALLWRECFEHEMKKSKLDATQTDQDAREARAKRQAINFMIQASVGELMNKGCAQLVERNYCLRLQMHDEIVVEVPDNEEDIEKAKKDIKDAFEVTLHGVKFAMDINTGSSWSCGKE